ncbi:succinyldiaminopimelate transaminase [Candidatus Rhodoluna planktonica]|uniref:Aminotransferase n=1 Tax=Candidatus Rhodoluna planktonica TaxID=535712 RepID=A0A1D9DYE0_9MICO|nr:succinyldiaminopimelate transaminase [Candidatus Rhodoluna planktonica]AOY55838.1 succinyldiaminopimelate transaminase [Candidatus Rhodoluna planktonica]
MFDRLPEYPWKSLEPFAAKAAAHPGGAVDLSVGSPVDPTPAIIQDALNAASNAPGYPSTAGSAEFRQAVVEWFERRRKVSGLKPTQVMPTIGSKELISWLPLMLGLGPGDVVVQPKVAYTAYVVGAALCGAEIVSEDDPAKWPENSKLIWINSPGNPDGRVLDVEHMRAAVDRARELGALLASDECYAELGWGKWSTELIPSVLDPRVCGTSHHGVLAVYSLSKQSNMAGYRAAFAVGEEALIKALVNLRMHSGLNTPNPVQKAMAVALADEEHVAIEKEIYRQRRDVLLAAVRAYGFELSDSQAGLYLWATLGEDCWKTVDRMAELGIVVVPGTFYGEHSTQHVRFSITATDKNIAEAAQRLHDAIGLSKA